MEKDAAGRVVLQRWQTSDGVRIDSTVGLTRAGTITDETLGGVDARPGAPNHVYDAAGRLTEAWVAGHHYTYDFTSTAPVGMPFGQTPSSSQITRIGSGRARAVCGSLAIAALSGRWRGLCRSLSIADRSGSGTEGVVTDPQQRVQAMMRSFQEQVAKAGQLQEAMKDIRGVGRSRDGAVTVTAASSGAVLGLQLSPAAMSRTHVALQQDILDAIRMATQNAAQQLDAAVAPVLGDRLQEFKAGLAASGVQPIMPSAPAPPGAPPSAPVPPDPVQRNRPPRPPVQDDDEPPSTYLR
ncbi:YbaB/EbfC family nucleoid-associated protein [Saccharothrix variisporea]|uniref:YbaB/EbfC family nucleoid-associated protein n=1 Tax=Saccharothrix variisporea TaxID=543527 RepID=UPI001FE84C90|nr:YbaB/EbfC family nucleoid-associated protein [Saccharothrix variisporea]